VKRKMVKGKENEIHKTSFSAGVKNEVFDHRNLAQGLQGKPGDGDPFRKALATCRVVFSVKHKIPGASRSDE